MAQGNYHWIVEGRIVLLRLIGDYDVESMRAALPAFDEFLQSSSPPIYLIVDQTKMTGAPRSFREPIQAMRPISEKYQVAWTIIITSNVLLRFFGTLVSNTLGTQFRPVASLAEALDVLRRIAPHLEPQIRAAALPPDAA